MEKAGPGPVFGPVHQAASYRIAVDVFQFLDMFAGSEHVEIIIARLPEWALPPLHATESFNALIAFESSAFFGSVTSRWTCSGMTTYPKTWKSYRTRIFSSERSKRFLALGAPRCGGRR